MSTKTISLELDAYDRLKRSKLNPRESFSAVVRSAVWPNATTSRQLRTRGERIGDNDIWIAATALAHQQPIVTRRTNDFHRIDGPQILTY